MEIIVSDQKICTTCSRSLPLDQFSKNKARKDGLDAKCKECLRIKNKAQYAKHAEKRRAYATEYARTHVEEKSAYNKEYRKKNGDKLNAYVREWRSITGYHKSPEALEKSRLARSERYRNDPEYRARSIAKSKEWRANNKWWVEPYRQTYNTEYRQKHREELNAKNRQKYHENPEPFKKQWREYVANNREHVSEKKKEWAEENRDRTLASEHKYRIKNRARIIERAELRRKIIEASERHFTEDDIVRKAAYSDGCCFYCNAPMTIGTREKTDRSIDHIVPLALGGDNSSDNVALCCISCNSSKRHRLLHEEWTPESIDVNPEIKYQHIYELLSKIAYWSKTIGEKPEFSGRSVLEFPSHHFRISVTSLFWDSERYEMKPILSTDGTIHLYEDELEQNMMAIQNTLAHAFGKSVSTYARKTQIDRDVPYGEAMTFLENNHLNGKTPVNTIRYGLRSHNGILVSLATFGKNGLTKKLKENEWELSRLAFSGNVPGGASKIISAFISDNSPERIITYTDPSKMNGGVYSDLGFKQDNSPSELSVYVQNFERFGGRTMRNRVIDGTLPYTNPEISVWRNTRINGIYRIHYPGVARFVWLNTAHIVKLCRSVSKQNRTG